MLKSSAPSPGVLQFDFNRPEKHNALNSELYVALAIALRAAHLEPSTRAIVLTATGKSFCSGNDIGEFDTDWPQPDEGPVIKVLRALYDIDVPVIAAVQGGAIGIGATLLLRCDVIFAAPTAYLRYPFVDLGVAPEGGSSHFLFQWLGRAPTMEVLLTGRKIVAAEALSLGLISAVDTDPASAAHTLAEAISRKSIAAIRATKRLARRSLSAHFPALFFEEIAEVNGLLIAQRSA